MADSELQRKLQLRKARVAYSEFSGKPESLGANSIAPTDVVPSAPPPPPMPIRSQPKVDLRPLSMREKGSEGKPHVDAVVQPQLREINFAPPSAIDLQNKLHEMKAKKNRKERKTNVSNVSGNLPTPPSSPGTTRKGPRQLEPLYDHLKDETFNVPSDTKSEVMITQDDKTVVKEAMTEAFLLKQEMQILSAKVAELNSEREQFAEERIRKYVESTAAKSPEDYERMTISSNLDDIKMSASKINAKVSPRDSASVISSPPKSETGRSQYSTTSGGKSILKRRSSRSISFSLEDDEADATSETSKDDVYNLDAGADDELGTMCDKFSISGPYNDDELNVIHAICAEYTEVARLTLARRSFFSRSAPHYVRVYGYLSSNRRSRWLNKNDWTNGMIGTKVLDHIFRPTLRSKSLKINRPRMRLDDFDQDRTLTENRFKRIMKKLFTKREELVLSIVGSTPAFGSIA